MLTRGALIVIVLGLLGVAALGFLGGVIYGVHTAQSGAFTSPALTEGAGADPSSAADTPGLGGNIAAGAGSAAKKTASQTLSQTAAKLGPLGTTLAQTAAVKAGGARTAGAPNNDATGATDTAPPAAAGAAAQGASGSTPPTGQDGTGAKSAARAGEMPSTPQSAPTVASAPNTSETAPEGQLVTPSVRSGQGPAAESADTLRSRPEPLLLTPPSQRKRAKEPAGGDAGADTTPVIGAPVEFPMPALSNPLVEPMGSGHEPSTPPRYSLQAGAFLDRSNVESIRAALARKGYDFFIVETVDAQERSWWRLRIGAFRGAQAAHRLETEIERREGLELVMVPYLPPSGESKSREQ